MKRKRPSARMRRARAAFKLRASSLQRASIASRLRGRMPIAQARKIWRNKSILTEQALIDMTRWSRLSAYRTFGPRGLKRGRRPASETDLEE